MNIHLIQNLKKKFLTMKIKNFIFLSIFIVILLIVAIYPTSKKMSLTGRQVQDLKDNILERQTDEYDLEDTANNYEKYESKLNLLNQAIISKDRELEFITSLEEIATQNNLEQKINIEEAQIIADKTYSKMSLAISLKGEFKNNLKYLQKIEKLPIYLNVKKININTLTNKESATTTSMMILADTFWQ